MTRIASKFGIAAALTLGMFATAAAQTTGRTTTPTRAVPLSKDLPGEVVKPDTVYITRYDTVTGPTMYSRDTITVAGPTVTRWDTVSVLSLPGWMDRGNGLYFGLGAGSYYPSAGIGAGQIPGYAFQANLGVDPKGSPLGLRLTAGVARPDEAQPFADLGGRPTVLNFTGDLKLRLPIFRGTSFPMFSLYGVGGGAYVRYKDLRMQSEDKTTVTIEDREWHDKWGWNAGGGAALQLGHKRELFLEARAINFSADGFENGHQLPIILGVNWY
jgi:hypothetical protein